MDGEVPALSVGDFAALRARQGDYALLDVREPWEVALGALPEAMAIPMNELPDRLDSLPADRPLVVLCHHGQRSGHVTAWLRRLGYDNAVNLEGGIDAEHNSLVAALDAQDVGVMLAVALAEVLSGEIDFNNDLRRGDRFSLLYEEIHREERFEGSGRNDDLSFSRYGDVLATEFTNDGRRLQAFRFQVPGEPEAQYFDQNGRSMKRLFLRSPFRFEPRITSRFSYRRVHPILGGVRPHLGVDYGAPTGTPVIAVATGTVVSAGRSGGSGNMIRLRHTNGYETYYLHLSAFARGISRGARVFQGQEIGYVGSTGLSTGPHLDYRMRRDGAFVNPLLEHRNLPPGDPVPDEHLAAFRAVRDAALARLGSPPGPGAAASDAAQ